MISVVIPTYKNRGGVARSIDSALSQVCNEEVEILVVDDNPPGTQARKETEMVMMRYNDEPRVIYIKHPENKNGAAARNTGIFASKGDYIAFLDDDDLFLPGKISKQVDFLESHPEYDAVYCLARRNGKPYGTDTSEGDCTKELLMLQTCIYTPCQMFRREALLKINGYDESFRRHQDYDLLLRFFHAGYKIGCLAEILTEIGSNEGENIPSGKKLEDTKRFFFEKFMPYVDEVENKDQGFKKKVLARHYAGVFLNHVKHHHVGMALSTFYHFFWESPSSFLSVISNSLHVHLKGIV